MTVVCKRSVNIIKERLKKKVDDVITNQCAN